MTAVPRERPIIMTGESVRAVIEGRKTQTRRVVNTGRFPQEYWDLEWSGGALIRMSKDNIVFNTPCGLPARSMQDRVIRCPYGAPGDRLWVRETWGLPPQYAQHIHGPLTSRPRIGPVCYGADYGDATRPAWDGARWRSPIHMPRWASRLTLEITGVRVERVGEISEEDARAEGVEPEFEVDLATFVHGRTSDIASASTYRLGFKHAWDRINKARGYPFSASPWVWVLTFRRTGNTGL